MNLELTMVQGHKAGQFNPSAYNYHLINASLSQAQTPCTHMYMPMSNIINPHTCLFFGLWVETHTNTENNMKISIQTLTQALVRLECCLNCATNIVCKKRLTVLLGNKVKNSFPKNYKMTLAVIHFYQH